MLTFFTHFLCSSVEKLIPTSQNPLFALGDWVSRVNDCNENATKRKWYNNNSNNNNNNNDNKTTIIIMLGWCPLLWHFFTRK